MPMVDWLGSPIWQGFGAFIGLAALLAYLWFDVRGRRANATAKPAEDESSSVRQIAIVDAQSEQSFYGQLRRAMKESHEGIYLTGYGFQSDRKEPQYREILRVEEEALMRGVEIVRIHTGTRVAPSWAEGYARLLEKFPAQFRMVVDFEKLMFCDVGLFDPHGHRPVVDLLFETRESAPLGPRRRPALAVFIEGDRRLAATLAEQFAARTKELTPLTAADVRCLARTYIYFGWGVHMASRQITRDVPDVRPLGTAIIRGWRRDISAMLAGPADRATIERTDDPADSFDGVAYELSWWGKARLDRCERRAYYSVPVTVEIDGHEREAFTYVPLPSSSPNQPLSPGSWMDSVMEGALENNMTKLLGELRSMGARVDAARAGPL